MLAGLQAEIRQLQAEEARRQAQLAAQARARLAAQQRAAESASASRQCRRPSVPDSSTSIAAARRRRAHPAPPRRRSTAASSGSRCSTSAFRTSGAARARAASTAPGLVAYVYAQVGVSLPHHAASMYGYGTPVSQSDLQPGDLVFFSGLGHVGHLHRRRAVHPRPAYGRRRQDLEHLSLAATSARTAPVAGRRLRPVVVALRLVERLDRVGEVLHGSRARFSFSVGVTSSCSIVKSRGRIANRLICS